MFLGVIWVLLILKLMVIRLYYKKHDNITRDAYGRIIAQGDAGAMLIK